MIESSKLRRDAFTFSLAGLTAMNSHSVVPVVSADAINQALDRRRVLADQPARNRPDVTIRIENMLARFFAPGCCRSV